MILIRTDTPPVHIDDTKPLVLPAVPSASAIAALPVALVSKGGPLSTGGPKLLFDLIVTYRASLGGDVLRYRNLTDTIVAREAAYVATGHPARVAVQSGSREELKRIAADAYHNAVLIAGFAKDLEAYVGPLATEQLVLTPPPMPKDGVPWDKKELAALRVRHAKLCESGRCGRADMERVSAAVRHAVSALGTPEFSRASHNAADTISSCEQAGKKRS